MSISDEGQPPSSSRRHLALWLFATFQFFYLLTSTGRVRTSDEYNTLYTTESLVLHGTTAVPQAVALHNFYGRPDVHGQPRAAYPPGQAVACMPWYAVGQYALARLPGVPAEDTDLVVAFASCLSSATFAALTVTFFFLLLVGIGTPLRATLLATAMLGLATPIFAYSAWLFSEPLSAAIFTGVAWLLFGRSSKLRNSMPEEGNGQNIEVQDEVFGKRKPISPQTAAIAGLILGLATLVRPTNVIAIAVFAVAVMMKNGEAGGCPSACPEPVEGFAPGFSALTWAWRSIPAALALCVASAVGVVILLAHNALLFGSPFAFGYPAIAEGAKRLNSFDTPILKGLYGFLLSPGKSAFLFAPPIILALIGLGALWRRDRGLATVAILLPLADLLFFAKYSQWEGGYCVGPRYLVPALVLLCVGLGPVLANAGARIKTLAVVLLVAGALVQSISLATSFMEDQAPRGHYYDANWTYRLGYSLAGQVHLFFKYLGSSEPARLGLGWDRWFVFLAKGGISRATLAMLVAAMAAGFGISILGLAKSVAAQSEGMSRKIEC
ncbi:MAG: hypothetical protein WAU58_11520 [Terriglobales bacterium]